jgi:hypothetical protein
VRPSSVTTASSVKHATIASTSRAFEASKQRAMIVGS